MHTPTPTLARIPIYTHKNTSNAFSSFIHILEPFKQEEEVNGDEIMFSWLILQFKKILVNANILITFNKKWKLVGEKMVTGF